MRKQVQRALLLVVSIVISGCAAQNGFNNYPRIDPYDLKLADFSSWQKAAAADRDAGNLQQSAYLKEMYRRLAEPPVRELDTLIMERVNALIPAAEKRERNEISEEEYKAAQRQAEINYLKAEQSMTARQRQEMHNRQMLYQQQVIANQPIYQPRKLEPYQMQVPQRTTCTTIGIQTDCITR